MARRLLLSSLALLLLVHTATCIRISATCTELVIPVSIVANNTKLSPDFNLDQLRSLLGSGTSLAFDNPITGTYNITGRYCEPLPSVSNASRKNVLQLLAHPATYDRNYWSGGGYPGFGYSGNEYSWIESAAKQGYPTLAIDRLGNGNSSHPDSIAIVQCPAQAATIHEIITLARAGRLPIPRPRSFTKIVFVGESLGSLVGNFVNYIYPTDIDATILQGFSLEWISVIPGFTVTAGLTPAYLVNKTQFPYSDPGYLAATSQPGVEFLLFSGSPGENYDKNFILKDYANRGTITLGEAASGANVPPCPAYTGHVLVVTGQNDAVFCGTSLGLDIQTLGLEGGDCGTGPSNKLALTKSIYPNADYSYYALQKSGHCWQHQFYVQEGYTESFNWLAGLGY